MIRDALYRKIIERLNGTVDPDLFEQCAVDLLRPVYPGLVPIRGGSDSGMDGAITDLRGEPLPLVTTTSPRAKPNLTHNLKEYVKDGHTRRQAVFATCRALTAPKRDELNKRAGELGFVLLNIHEQADFADRLYRDPQWRLELLGITGDPAPLSIVPKSERPFLNLPLIGRDADLAWLRDTEGDKLLIGQPGSGKTYLLRKFASKRGGLFVNTYDRSQIADGIRAQQPRVLIIDDAQLKRELLLELRQLRDELRAPFAILATGWPGDQADLAGALNLPSAQVRTLALLPRPDIVEIIKATGIQGPNLLVRELVDQAEGRPGLAVTLADLCLKGDVRQVALGDALSRSLLTQFKLTIGTRATSILAAISVGGNAGMTMQVVADALQLTLVDVKDAVVKLAAGGVILQLPRGQLAVRPPALREVLARDVFFGDATALPIEHLLMQVLSPVDAAFTLIGARGRGAVIPQDLFATTLERADSDPAWEAYAYLGRDETNWVLTAHPEKQSAIARPALVNLPEATVPRLMEIAIGDQRELGSAPEHPLRLIVDWLQAGEPGTGEPVRRRQIVLDAALAWLKSGKDTHVGVSALVAAFSPRFEAHEGDPGAGLTVTFHRGFPTLEELVAIQRCWQRAIEVLQVVAVDDWEPLGHLIGTWAYPEHLTPTPSESMCNSMRSFARRLLLDIVAVAGRRAEVGYWAIQLAKDLQIEVPIQLDADFQTLYPFLEHEDPEAGEERQRIAVSKLAFEWSLRDPQEVIDDIKAIENTARKAKIHFPRWTPFLCSEIADHVTSPNRWAKMLAPALKNGDLVFPFLQKAAVQNEPGWTMTADSFLDQPEVKSAAITVVLKYPEPPPALLNKCLGTLEGYGQLIESLCMRAEVPDSTLHSLLRHQDARIACGAAIGEWHRHRDHAIPISVQQDWSNAIVRSTAEEYWLRHVLIRDAALAQKWLERRLAENSLGEFRLRQTVSGAISVLDVVGRRNLLRALPDAYDIAETIGSLVDDDLDLYRDLLGIERLESFHLVPLGGSPDGIWIEKAKLALEAGYSAQQVAMAAYPSFLSWRGPESEMRAGWVRKFDLLCLNEDDRIRQVGELGKAHAEERLRRAVEEERREAIYGRY